MKTSGWFVIGLLAVVGAVLAGLGTVSAQTAADADFDGSGDVGFQDFLLFAAKFNTSEGDGAFEAKFDIDGNGNVGFTDFLTFARFFGETVPEPVLALTGVAPAEGMPGTLIELLGQFDANTTYQVKFDTVLLPVFAQSPERITAMVPVLPAAAVPIRVVDATGKESEAVSFEVLVLPEPRMDAAQLRETVADVGTGIANVIAPLTRADVIFNDAGAALFNQEMGKLNAAWDVLGQRIEALPPQDAAMLAHLLDNSGALEILEALGQIDLSASKLAAESSLTHNLLFRVDIVSAIIGYASDLVMVGAIASAVAPEPLFTKAMTGAMGGISTLLGVLKSGIDTTIPTDLQEDIRVEISPTPVPFGRASNVAFYGTFKTESNLLTELGAFGVGKGMEEIVKLLILKRKGKAFLDELLENETLSNAVDEIVGFFSGILSDVGFGLTGLENLFENVAIPRYDEPLDMSLYRLSLPSMIKWIIPPFPAEEIDKMVGVLEKVGIDLVSESVEVVDGRDEVNREVAEYDPVTGKLKGHRAGETRLKMRVFRFVEPGGGSESEPEDENRGFWRRVWDRAVNVVRIPLDLITNINPIFRFSNSMDRLAPEYHRFTVYDPLEIESIRRLTHNDSTDVDPRWSPDSRQIAFVSHRDGNREIYVMGVDGSNPRNLTNNDAVDSSPAWSPDSRHIAFVSDRDDNEEIYVMGSDGSNPRNLSNNPRSSDVLPAWSPDSLQIAYASHRGREGRILVTHADGSNLRSLERGDWRYHSIAWIGVGQSIGFSRKTTMRTYSRTFGSMSVGVRQLDSDRARGTSSGYSPAWSPDGLVVYANEWTDTDKWRATDDADNWDIFRSWRNRLTRHFADDTNPVWSPDSRHIAFVTNRDGNGEIYGMDEDGINLRNLTNHEGWDANPAWSPDGRHIAFVSSRDGNSEIYLITFRRDAEEGDGE